MKIYRSLDFVAARRRAFEHLGRFFTTHKRGSQNLSLEGETWLVELEIDAPDGVICLEIEVHLEPDFPLSLPFIHLSRESVAKLDFLPNIHSATGEICTFDRNTSIPDPEKPAQIVEACVRKAKRIIEEGLSQRYAEQYDQEFLAYWEITYDGERRVDRKVLSLVDDRETPSDQLTYVLLQGALGHFHALLYSEQEQFYPVKEYLIRRQIGYREIPTCFIGQLRVLSPPFSLRNKGVLQLVESLGQRDEFKRYLDSRPYLPIVTFSKTVDDRNLILGWRHSMKESGGLKEKHLRRKYFKKLFSSENESLFVERFSPQTLTWDRLSHRTAADYRGLELRDGLKVLVAGLGSVGSNLVPFLESIGATEYRLVDPDVLSLENIGRHLLGINDVGKDKTKAIRDYLQRKNPLITVHTKEARIVPIAIQEPTFLEDCDYRFFCTGDINSEMWLMNNLNQDSEDPPTFLIWVEPYLAGGHCVYFNGEDQIHWNALFDNHKFVYNVISNEFHDEFDFTKREAGCQVTYFPYSAAILELFLAAIFPRIFKIIGSEGKSRCFSWIGDLDTLRDMNIELSSMAEEKVDSFSLVERSIC